MVLDAESRGALARQARHVARQAEFDGIDDTAFARAVGTAYPEVLPGEVDVKVANAAKIFDMEGLDSDHV